MATRVNLVKRVWRDGLAALVSTEVQANRVKKADQALLASRDNEVMSDQLDYKVLPDRRDTQVSQETTESQAFQEQRDQREPWVSQVLLDPLVCRE